MCLQGSSPVRKASQVRTSPRVTSNVTVANRNVSSSKKSKQTGVVNSKIEMDSHADTIVCGSNCCIMDFTGKECEVSPYTEAYDTIKGVPIVQAATAYDNTDTGETSILIFNQAIWMGDVMDHTLVNPNQLRAY